MPVVFDLLFAVGAKNVPVAYCPDLEEAILPQSADVLKAIRENALRAVELFKRIPKHA